MSENSDEISKSNEQCVEKVAHLEEKSPKVPINSVQFMMLETLVKKQNEQEKFNKESLENQQKVLEKLELMQIQLDELKSHRNPADEPVENTMGNVDEKPDEQKKQQPIEPQVSKQFILKHSFKNVSADLIRMDSPYEEFFGVNWCVAICKTDDKFGMYLQCKHAESGTWAITTNFELKVFDSNQKAYSAKFDYCYEENKGRGWAEYLKWDDLEKNYLINGELRVEICVKIQKMSGVYKDDLRIFDDPECSDIVLIVNDKKFHVAKLYLVAHSQYFKAMFLGMFGEAKKSEIELSGVEADDFQKYLEVLYGEYSIDENTVEGILLVADMYDTPIVIRKCEEFLQKESEKTLKKKLELSVRYHLGNLKMKCLAEMKTGVDIRSILPSNFRDMDPSIIADLLEKSLSLK